MLLLIVSVHPHFQVSRAQVSVFIPHWVCNCNGTASRLRGRNSCYYEEVPEKIFPTCSWKPPPIIYILHVYNIYNSSIYLYILYIIYTFQYIYMYSFYTFYYIYIFMYSFFYIYIEKRIKNTWSVFLKNQNDKKCCFQPGYI